VLLRATFCIFVGNVVLIVFVGRKLLQATVRANKTGHFKWFGSDSWGAKVHPVRDQEWAAEDAITILPTKTSLTGQSSKLFHLSARICNFYQSA
jgi:hypothetical protein